MRPDRIDTSTYEQQLAAKATWLQELMAPFDAPELELFRSAPEHYRMRAEFRVWHQGDDLNYIMFDADSKAQFSLTQFLPGSRQINDLMPELITRIKSVPTLRKKLFQVDFLSTQTGECLISLLYHRQLDDEWEAAARQLKSDLQSFGDIHIIGRARKQKWVIEQDFVTECLNIQGRSFRYQQIENSFTQPNAGVCEQMIGWALDCTATSEGDLLELYCGNGNFTLPLAQNFRRVLATEISKSSVNSAQHNMQLNGIDNVDVIRMSSEEFTQAMQGVRAFRRLEGIDLTSYICNTIFVDPPRAGLDPDTLALVQGYPNILYISCNPETLKDNLEQLQQTHTIERLALFDQFPYTHHCEAGVWLRAKN